MPKPCMPIRKSRMASSVRKNALKIGPSSPKRLRPTVGPFADRVLEVAPHRDRARHPNSACIRATNERYRAEIGLGHGLVPVDSVLSQQSESRAAIQQSSHRVRFAPRLRRQFGGRSRCFVQSSKMPMDTAVNMSWSAGRPDKLQAPAADSAGS